jgi:transposase
MLQVTSKHRVFLAVQAIDFRRGIDGIAALCRNQLQHDPMTGHLFIFRNRKTTSIKVLAYDSQGYWLCQKRLSRGSFTCWPKSSYTVVSMNAAQLHLLLYNGDPTAIPADNAQWQSITDDDDLT